MSKNLKSHVNETLRKSKVGRIIIAMLYQFANNGKLSGRADGNVYMRNGRIRGMTVPSLVQNSATATVRGSLANLSTGWNGLTDAQRLTWNEATGFTTTDRFGMSKAISGKNLYVSLNRNLFSINFSAISVAPLPQGIGAPTLLTFVADESAQTIALTFEPNPVPADTYWAVFATAQKNPGVYRPGASDYRLVTVMSSLQASPFAFGAAYVARFGALVVGRKIFIKLVAVNSNTGQAITGLISENEVIT